MVIAALPVGQARTARATERCAHGEGRVFRGRSFENNIGADVIRSCARGDGRGFRGGSWENEVAADVIHSCTHGRHEFGDES